MVSARPNKTRKKLRSTKNKPPARKLKKIKKPSRLISYAFLLINTICWGASLILVKPALEHTTPIRFLLYRYAFASLFSLPLMYYYLPKIKKPLTALRKITLIELIGTVLALTMLYAGLERTTAIEASLLSTTTPIFVVLAGIILIQEKQTKKEWLGLALAFLGTLMIALIPDAFDSYQNSGISVSGNLLIIAHNISTAIYFVMAKKHYQQLPKLFVAAGGFLVGLFAFAILSFVESQNAGGANLVSLIAADFKHLSVWTASLYMAIFGSIIGLTAYIKGQDGIEASEAGLFWYLQPLIYLPLGVLFLSEKMHWSQILGLSLVLLGVAISHVVGRLRR